MNNDTSLGSEAMMNKRRLFFALPVIAVLTLVITACGGGGSGADDVDLSTVTPESGWWSTTFRTLKDSTPS